MYIKNVVKINNKLFLDNKYRNLYENIKRENCSKLAFNYIKVKNNIIIIYIIIIYFFIIIFVLYKKKLYIIRNLNYYYYKDAFNASIIENHIHLYNDFIKEMDNKKRNAYNEFLKKNNYFGGKLFWKNETSLGLNKIKNEIKYYRKFNISFDKKEDFIKRENPKISLVVTLHNQEKYIIRIYSSIQKQDLKDIEIIFVDDASRDNTTKIVNNLMMKDKRIIYLKNNKTKRAFYSRNEGILHAKGEFILVIDPDDLIINNILIKAYETAVKYRLDIVQFYALKGNFESPSLWIELKNNDGILKNNSEIRNNFYHCISRNLWDKLVKNEIYKKSIDFIDKKFYNLMYFINNDDTAFFGLLHVAHTYGFLEQIGYFYIFKPSGSYYYRTDPKNMNKIFMSIFNNMRYFYIQSDNNTVEKSNLPFRYFEKNMKLFSKFIPYLTKGIDSILDVFDLYLNSTYFNNTQKKKIFYFKKKFLKRKIYKI